MEFSDKFDVPVECIIEALEICLNRNCSTYQGQYWLQNDGILPWVLRTHARICGYCC